MTEHRAATLTEVARRAGVSVTTASKALNGKSKVSDETRSRVLAVARELAYVPNPLARSLLNGRSGTVGLIIVDTTVHRVAMPLMLGAEAALQQVDLSLLVADAGGSTDRLRRTALQMRHRKVDGLLVLGDNNASTPSLGEGLGTPAVYVYGESSRSSDVVHVPDDAHNAALVVAHLVATGRRRLVHITGPDGARAVAGRCAGFATALDAHGLRPAAEVLHGPWSQRFGRAAIEALLTSRTRFDAVVCGSDQIAAGVVDGLQRHGLEVPADVAVSGFDNWLPFATETDPGLTTVDLQLEALGGAAVRDLFDLVDGRPVAGGVRLHPGALVVRDSTAAPVGPPAVSPPARTGRSAGPRGRTPG